MNNYDSKPPKLGLKILQTFFDEDDFFELSKDMAEEFTTIAAEKGIRCARQWYWQQIVKSLPSLAHDKVNGGVFWLKTKIGIPLVKIINYKVRLGVAGLLIFASSLSMGSLVTCSKMPTASTTTELLKTNYILSANSESKSKIVFFSDMKGNDYQIFTVNADGSNLKNLSKNSRVEYEASWSPDGSKITFCSGKTEDETDIYIMNSNGDQRINLTNDKYRSGNPAWSPDGKKIVYSSYQDGNWDIFMVNISTKEKTRLTYSSAHDLKPNWSPDGERIVFLSEREYPNGIETEIADNWEIYTMNADGSNKIRLTKNRFSEGNPEYSPDGKKIAFNSNRDGNFEIYIMNSDGSNVRRVTYNSRADYDPSWSPDGKKLVFESDSGNGNYDLFIMNIDGSLQMQLTNNSSFNHWPKWTDRLPY